MITHNTMEEQKLLEYAALAECSSSHPISKSLQKAYGKEIDRSRVTDIEEISGHGLIAKVDGVEVAAGNAKLMTRLGISYADCHSVGTIIHVAINGEYAGHILISDIEKPNSKAAIAALKKAGVEKTVMLTGDAKRVAEQVAANIDIDMIVQNVAQDNTTDFTFTVNNVDYDKALDVLQATAKEIGAGEVSGTTSIAKVSIVGVGMRSHPGVASSMFEALAKENINIQMISTSEIRVSVVIDEKYVELAVRA